MVNLATSFSKGFHGAASKFLLLSFSAAKLNDEPIKITKALKWGSGKINKFWNFIIGRVFSKNSYMRQK
jgi:hypothetical protein